MLSTRHHCDGHFGKKTAGFVDCADSSSSFLEVPSFFVDSASRSAPGTPGFPDTAVVQRTEDSAGGGIRYCFDHPSGGTHQTHR